MLSGTGRGGVSAARQEGSARERILKERKGKGLCGRRKRSPEVPGGVKRSGEKTAEGGLLPSVAGEGK